MSAPLLQYPGKPAELSDAIESFVHLLYYLLLCFHEHSMPPLGIPMSDYQLALFLDRYFHARERTGDSQHFGGSAKLAMSHCAAPPFAIRGQDGRPLPALLRALHHLCATHYRSLDLAALDKYLHPEQRYVPQIADRSPQAPISWDLDCESDDSLMEDMARREFNESLLEPICEPERPPDPFANHKPMLGLLKTVIKMPGWLKHDKTRDRFLDLPNFVWHTNNRSEYCFS